MQETHIRLDSLLVQKGLARSRGQAADLIKSHSVKFQVISKKKTEWILGLKASQKVKIESEVIISNNPFSKYVSRGGVKLEGAFKYLNLCAKNKTFLDIGQSTGGFSDFLLQSQAQSVTGIDIGHSQTVESIKNNPKCLALEKINISKLTESNIEKITEHSKVFDGIVIDISFISAIKIFDRTPQFLKKGGFLLSLIKPQFELTKKDLNKKGLVKNMTNFKLIEDKAVEKLYEIGFSKVQFFQSPIDGADGNKEFFIYGLYQ